VYAAEVAQRLGRIDAQRVAEHRRVLRAYDLPSRLPTALDDSDLIELFGRDKKAVDGLTLVLDGENGVESVSGIDEAVLRDALGAIR
jgi:5-deoxy-5-amino-3-dehydroquinate synthase